MIDSTRPPGRDAWVPVGAGPLTPGLRRDLADLNAQYLKLGLAVGLEVDPRFAWSEAVRDRLRQADESTLERLAAAPFALFDVVLPVGPETPAARVEDSPPAVRAGSLLVQCESFAHQAAFMARQLVAADGLAARVTLSLSAEAQAWLMNCRPSQLAELARDLRAIRPRWRLHAYFWQMMVGAAQRGSPAALEWAHCIGLCLLGADDEAPLPRRRARR
jgi:hypothetical protein